MRRQIVIFYNAQRNNDIIKKQAIKRKNIIYGARSIQAQIGLFSRPTEDWDIFSIKPKRDSEELQKQLDKQVGFDYYYSQPAVHKGTYKVKGSGFDLKKKTKDDESVADFTNMPKPMPSYVTLSGIRYRILKEEIKAKKSAIADPNYAFRKEKDLSDLRRIESLQRASKMETPLNILKKR